MEIPKLLEVCIYYFNPQKGFQYLTFEHLSNNTFNLFLWKYIDHLFETELITFFSGTNSLSRTYREVSGEQYQGQ